MTDRSNGVRRFILLVSESEPSLGCWVDEYDRLIQIPTGWGVAWKGEPLSSVRAWAKDHHYTVTEPGRRM